MMKPPVSHVSAKAGTALLLPFAVTAEAMHPVVKAEEDAKTTMTDAAELRDPPTEMDLVETKLLRFTTPSPSPSLICIARAKWLKSPSAATKFGRVIDYLSTRVRAETLRRENTLTRKVVHISANCQTAYGLMWEMVAKMVIPHDPYSSLRLVPVSQAYQAFTKECEISGDAFVSTHGWEDFTIPQFWIFVDCLLKADLIPELTPSIASAAPGDGKSEMSESNSYFLSSQTHWSWASSASNMVRALYADRFPELADLEAILCREECCWWHQYGDLEDEISCPSFPGSGRPSPKYSRLLALARLGQKHGTATMTTSSSSSSPPPTSILLPPPPTVPTSTSTM